MKDYYRKTIERWSTTVFKIIQLGGEAKSTGAHAQKFISTINIKYFNECKTVK